MDMFVYSKLWTKFTEQNNNLKKYINKLTDYKYKCENLDKLAEYALEYFETGKCIERIMPTNPKDNTEKIYKAYLEADLGEIAIEFDKLKQKRNNIYKYIMQKLKNMGCFYAEELLEKYHKNILENYTPRDIHIMSGGGEDDYDGWY